MPAPRCGGTTGGPANGCARSSTRSTPTRRTRRGSRTSRGRGFTASSSPPSASRWRTSRRCVSSIRATCASCSATARSAAPTRVRRPTSSASGRQASRRCARCSRTAGMPDLTGRVALVTGTAHGIGAGIAAALEANGAVVHGHDRDTVDASDEAQVSKLVAEIGPVDILVNNAGGVAGQVGRPLEEVSDDDWRAVIDANLTSTFVCTRAVAPGMKERRYGRIVNISSGPGRTVSLTGIQAYASAKAGQIGFTRHTAHELSRFGITVNAIAPGFVLSNPTSIAQWERYGADGQRRLLDAIATRRLGTPDDIATGVLFCVSEVAGWVTGQVLSV